MARNVLSVTIEHFKKGVEMAAQMLAKKSDMKIVFRGQDCKTDGKTIYLPEVAMLARANMTREEVKEAEDFLAALRGYLDHEVGHVLFTDFEASKAERRQSPKLHHTMNALEDIRIERKMASVWAGSGFNLKTTATYVFDHYGDVDKLRPVQQILTGIGIVGRTGYDDAHPLYKKLGTPARRFMEARQTRAFVTSVRDAKNTSEVCDLAKELLRRIKEEWEPAAQPPKEEEDPAAPPKKQRRKATKAAMDAAEESPPQDPFNEEEAEEEEVEEVEAPDGDGEAAEEPGDGGTAADEGDDEGDDEGEDGDAAGAGAAENEEEADEEAGGPAGAGEDAEDEAFRKGLKEDLENDAGFGQLVDDLSDAAKLRSQLPDPAKSTPDDYLVFTTENDVIEPPEIDDKGVAIVQYQELLDEVGASTLGVLQRGLRQYLQSRSYSFKVSDLDEGKIDRRRLYRLPTAISNKVFARQHERLDLENVAVSLWGNQSGSMGGKERITQQTILAFGETLAALEIPFEVCGHTTGSPDADVRIAAQPPGLPLIYSRYGTLWVAVYKSFEEDWRQVRHRITAFDTRANTYDAEVVKLASRRLMRRSENRKVLFLMDDGEPQPNFSESRGKHTAYLHEMVADATTAGIEVVGVGMQTNSVQRFYPRSVVVQNLNELGRVVLSQLKDVLTKKRKA